MEGLSIPHASSSLRSPLPGQAFAFQYSTIEGPYVVLLEETWLTTQVPLTTLSSLGASNGGTPTKLWGTGIGNFSSNLTSSATPEVSASFEPTLAVEPVEPNAATASRHDSDEPRRMTMANSPASNMGQLPSMGLASTPTSTGTDFIWTLDIPRKLMTLPEHQFREGVPILLKADEPPTSRTLNTGAQQPLYPSMGSTGRYLSATNGSGSDGYTGTTPSRRRPTQPLVSTFYSDASIWGTSIATAVGICLHWVIVMYF